MGIIEVKFLEDRVRVHYSLHKPIGMPDVNDKIDIFYDSIDKLPKVPNKIGIDGETEQKDIFVSKCNKTITLIFNSYRESSWQSEEDMYGPYLKEEITSDKNGNNNI